MANVGNSVTPGRSHANSLAQIVRIYGEKIRSKMDDVARSEAGEVLDEIVKGWPVDTGASRAGWEGPSKVGDAHYRVSNNIDYAGVIEHGGYRGVGPKTEQVSAHVLPAGIAVNGGIYPSQRPAAPVRRAISARTLPLAEAVAKAIRHV